MQPCGDRDRDRIIGGRHFGEQQEFIASDASKNIRRADHGAQTEGKVAQQPIAGGMPVRVIDHLEMIQIDQHHGRFIAIRTQALIQALLHGAAIDEPGQMVVMRAKSKLVFQALVQNSLARIAQYS